MSVEIVILLMVLLIGTVLFLTEFFTVDKTAFLIMVSLLVTGLISAEEAISGFSNQAVITILSLMIITYALEENNCIAVISELFIPLIKKPLMIALPLIMLMVGGFSAFISTTAVVILFVRIVPDLAKKHNIKIEKFMMPISYAGIMGGSCTLIGTSTNLIVNDVAIQNGLNGFSLFQFAHVGLALIAIGTVLTLILTKLFLKVNNNTLLQKERKSKYFTTVKLLPKNKMIGLYYKESIFYKDPRKKILQVNRNGNIIKFPNYSLKFQSGDVLIINSEIEEIIELKNKPEFEIISESAKTDGIRPRTGKIVELLILPNSKFIGKRLYELNSYELDGAYPLGLSKHKNILQTSLVLIENLSSKVRIDAGDKILVQLEDVQEQNWEPLDNSTILNLIELPQADRFKSYVSFFTILLVIGLVVFGVTNILQSSLIGVGLLIVTRSLSMEKAYRAINWPIIFMLACLIPLGTAMQNSQADTFISSGMLFILGGFSPQIILSLLFLFTMFISGVVSNNATAIVLTPIAISIAQSLGLSTYPFLITVMIAANFSFFTPVGYQTNTIVYGMGIYKFKDFVKVGGILSFVLWISASFIIPHFFPF